MHRPTVVGLGEALWDCFGAQRRPGGAPANVAFHANQLGCRGAVCTRVGADALGDELVALLAAQGLETQAVARDPEHPTGTVTVELSANGHPKFTIHEGVAWDALEFDDPAGRLAHEADAVCFGTLAQRAECSRKAIRSFLSAVQGGCLAVYDVNFRQHWYEAGTVGWSLDRADVVKLNSDEVEPLAELLDLPPASPAEFVGALRRRYNLRVVCLTRGDRGCLLEDARGTVDLPGIPVDVVDTVGAGDAFTAALIFGLLHDWPLEAAGGLANEVGALVASRSGAMPALHAEFAKLIARYGAEQAL